MTLTDSMFNIKQTVYLKTDIEQHDRIVIGILIRDSHICYELACGTINTWHYDFEITVEKDVLKTTTN